MVILTGLEAFLEPLGAILELLGVCLKLPGGLVDGQMALARAGVGFSGGRRGGAQVRGESRESPGRVQGERKPSISGPPTLLQA
jgi:hypothetical protein